MTKPSEVHVTETDIAVVGRACRFPGARDPDQFWRNLRDGVESITPLTDEQLHAAGVDAATLRNPRYVKAAAVLEGFDRFDASFFGLSPKDAAIMDPQHRQFIECSWEALEDAGHVPQRFPGSIGVHAGSGMTAYMMFNLLTNPELVESVGLFLLRHTGNDKDFLTTRVSHLLDLRGPSVNVQTACSTSLVAIHAACQSLLARECDLALAGGVTIEIPHGRGYLYEEGEILSPDGHCRAFDASSQGTVFGSGVGVVALRRLEDALADGDTIHAVIRGTAVNNDGSMKAGYLAPSVDGQAACIAEALAVAGVPADSISYVETHGTGTPVGDPIEIAALTQAFRQTTARRQFCAIGSVKPNIGHTDTAAGIASFIKVVEALRAGQIPPSLHFAEGNPACKFESSPFHVNARLTEWRREGGPRRAGVSSLGVGGTNAHVILEEAPQAAPSGPSRPAQVLNVSARTETSLDAATRRLAQHLKDKRDVNLADVAYTLHVGRQDFAFRRTVAASSREDAIAVLESLDTRRVFTRSGGQAQSPSVVFTFPGGGAQHANMGRELHETEPVYREELDRCFAILRPQLPFDLKALMFPAPGTEEAAAVQLEKTSAGLPAIFSTSWAMAKLLMSWGIHPDAMIGHSLGEYVAACLASTMTLEEALFLVTLRGKLFEKLPAGAMLSVALGDTEVRPFLRDGVDIGTINAPGSCVLSGRPEAIAAVENALAAREVDTTRLRIGIAAHSPMVEAILDEMHAGVSRIRLQPPKARWISNVTGTWIRPEEAQDPGYWVRHLRHTVRFSDGMRTLMDQGRRVFVEAGPSQALTSLARLQSTPPPDAVATMRHPQERASDVLVAVGALGRLWALGVGIDWTAFHSRQRRRRVPLPTYAFDQERFWIEPGRATVGVETPTALEKIVDNAAWFFRPAWHQENLPAEQPAAEKLRWLVFAEAQGLGARLAERLRKDGHHVVTAVPGRELRWLSDSACALNPREPADYQTLLAEMAAREGAPHRIVHAWTLGGRAVKLDLARFDAMQERGFYSLLFLAQALGDADSPDMHLWVVTNGVEQVGSEKVMHPEKATVLGPCKVIPQENPSIRCTFVDVELTDGLARLMSGRTASREAEIVVDLLVRELATPAPGKVVAHRGGSRFVQSHERTRLAAPTTTPLRPQGHYLITGGLGGIALVMAEHLARTARARLVLVGRSPMPAREGWTTWLSSHAADDPTSRKIRKVFDLERLGAEVMVASADVAQPDDVREIIAQARRRFGPLNGVVHAAGVLDDAPIGVKTAESAARVLSAKARSAVVLDSALQRENLDFFVLFSSTSAVLGPPGQVDYVAANQFLDALARARASRGDSRVVAVEWGVWQVGSSRVDLQACKLEYSIVSPK